jgi:hypothetical protein
MVPHTGTIFVVFRAPRSMLTDMFFAGIETIVCRHEFAFGFQEINQLQSRHIFCTAGMKAGIRPKAGFDSRFQAVASKLTAQLQHHVHDIVTVYGLAHGKLLFINDASFKHH